jgi:hypothetical protein
MIRTSYVKEASKKLIDDYISNRLLLEYAQRVFKIIGHFHEINVALISTQR